MSSFGKFARGAAWPVRRLLDPRFADVARRIEYANRRPLEESRQIEDRQSELASRLGSFGTASNESLAFLGRQIREFEGALGELTTRLEAIEGVLGPDFYSRRVSEVIAGGVDRLDGDSAALVGFAESHRGFAAQRR